LPSWPPSSYSSTSDTCHASSCSSSCKWVPKHYIVECLCLCVCVYVCMTSLCDSCFKLAGLAHSLHLDMCFHMNFCIPRLHGWDNLAPFCAKPWSHLYTHALTFACTRIRTDKRVRAHTCTHSWRFNTIYNCL
jgi:hypothetical protein